MSILEKHINNPKSIWGRKLSTISSITKIFMLTLMRKDEASFT